MSELNPQFYDQLAKRLDRQDSQLGRIEQSQTTILECVMKQKAAHTEHLLADKTNFKWLTYILGGVWAAIGLIVTFLLKH